MGDGTTYDVITNGEILDGYQVEQVIDGFAQLFKISPEKANVFLNKKRVVKKGLSLKQAHVYKQKLETIGLIVELNAQAPKVNSYKLALTLEPMEPARPIAADSSLATESHLTAQTDTPQSTVTCPKCQQVQEGGQFCVACGVCFDKVNKQSPAPGLMPAESVDPNDTSGLLITDAPSLKMTSLIACAIASAIGAGIWLFIALAFDYELGLVAWLIGGMVGYAAVMTGSTGQTAGMVCAGFTIIAILGGKYLTIESFQSQISDIVASAESQEGIFQQAFEEEKQIAKLYLESTGSEQAMRQFMVDHAYSVATRAEDVSQEEIEAFQTYDVPRLLRIGNNDPSYDQWLSNSVSDLENMSTIDIMTEDFDFLDVIFLLLGVFTAFRLGAGVEQ